MIKACEVCYLAYNQFNTTTNDTIKIKIAKIIDTLEEELTLYKKKYRDEVDNNEWKTKYRELLDGHWDQKMKQKSMTELNYDGNHNRGREGEDEENGV